MLYTRAAFARQERARDERLRLHRAQPGAYYHPLAGLIDDGASFAAKLPELRAGLLRRLAEGGFGPLAPKTVDLLLRAMLQSRCRVDPVLYRELYALVGDLAVARGSGSWSTRAGPLGVTEPIVNFKGDARSAIEPWRIVAALLDDQTPLAAALDNALATDSTPLRPADPKPDLGPPRAELGDRRDLGRIEEP